MLKFLDDFFLILEGNKSVEPEKKPTEAAPKQPTEVRSLGSLLYSMFVSKDYQHKGLAGWKDDKEKFKIDLLNDIKTFLFGKWEKPWKPGLIFDQNNKVISGFRNVTGRVYRNNSNIISLEHKCGESPYFITTKRLEAEGGKILDKTKIASVISYIPIFKNDEVKAVSGDDEVRKPDFMLPKFHDVINVDFTEGIKKPKYKTVDFKQLELNEYIEKFIEELKKRKRIPKLIYDQSDRCYYVHNLSFTKDEIHLVEIKQFKDIAGYYSTLFHEIIHSTKATSRYGKRDKKKGTDLEYANEELVAEMGALILCSELGLEYNRQNSLTYLKGWLSRAAGNSDDAMIEAYAFACDAAEYLLSGIDLESIVPKTMVKRAEENPTEPDPGTAKPDGKKSISNAEGEEKPVKSEAEPTKEKEAKEDEPEGGRNTASTEGKPEPKFQPGDKVSYLNPNKQRKEGIISQSRWVEDNTFGIKTEGWVYRLKAVQNQSFSESEFTLVEAKPKDLFDDSFLPRTKPDELSYQLAYRAHQGTSFSPEKRAKSHQDDYANTLNAYAEEFEMLAKNDEQKTIAKAEYDRVRGQKDEVKKASSAQTSLFGFQNLGKVQKSTAINLNGELGNFLGAYERKQYSIALRGDKGAGKTRLVYQLIDLFASQGLRCAFLSLEMPINSSITTNYKKEYIKPENLKLIDISDLSGNYFYLDGICKMYDVVVIDSWTKLKGVNQDDFDRLQKDNPQTIIVAIFQATTGKVTRGGNMPEYDAAVVIHVHKGGVAVCEKNRYAATDNEYLVFEQKLRVEEPTEAD